MKNILLKKSIIFAYHLIILALSWYFNLTFFHLVAWSLGIGDILILSSLEIMMITAIPIIQTIIFLAATIDGFSTLNLWWAKNIGWKINKSGKFMHWINKQKGKKKRQNLFASWQMKVMSLYLMINTILLTVILSLVFEATELTSLYAVSLVLVVLSFSGYCWYVIKFMEWMKNLMNSKAQIKD